MSENFRKLRELLERQKRVLKEININFGKLEKSKNKKIVEKNIEDLSKEILEDAKEFKKNIYEIHLLKKLKKDEDYAYESLGGEKEVLLERENLERGTLRRIREYDVESKNENITKNKPNSYLVLSNKIFGNVSKDLSNEGIFRTLSRDLSQANMSFLPASYISLILFTTLLSFFFSIAILILLFFVDFNVTYPLFEMYDGDFLTRLGQIFWVLIIFPVFTFVLIYSYPSLEKKNVENRIDQELPFATINMAAISGSMIDPTKIFSIIIATKEYPYLEKEFNKVLNEVNLYGYNLASALRRVSFNTASRRLGDLFNGLSTTITSGGDLPGFFDKRSQSLLFEYRIEREKYTRSAETFMDIYISVVIAAPMILMLVLILVSVSGLGFSLSAGSIALIMILGVSAVNFMFMLFLHLRQPGG